MARYNIINFSHKLDCLSVFFEYAKEMEGSRQSPPTTPEYNPQPEGGDGTVWGIKLSGWARRKGADKGRPGFGKLALLLGKNAIVTSSKEKIKIRRLAVERKGEARARAPNII